jgi:hypothetical protein
MKVGWERRLHLEASKRLYAMRRGLQSVLDAAQGRQSGAVADASRKNGQIDPKQQKWGLMKVGWGRRLRLEASDSLYEMRRGPQSVPDAAQGRQSG